MRILPVVKIMLFLFMLSGCAVYYGGDRYDLYLRGVSADDSLLFTGRGAGADLMDAQRDAQQSILLMAASELIGEDGKERQYVEIIRTLDQMTFLLVPGSARIIDWGEEHQQMWVELQARVDAEALLVLLADGEQAHQLKSSEESREAGF